MPIKIVVPEQDLWDESRGEFIPIKEHKLTLEHSLVSLTKWESKWCKPFLSPEEKTQEEVYDYIRCMVMNEEFDDNFVYAIPPKEIKRIMKIQYLIILSPKKFCYVSFCHLCT